MHSISNVMGYCATSALVKLSRCARGSQRVLGMSIYCCFPFIATAGSNERMPMTPLGAYFMKDSTLDDT